MDVDVERVVYEESARTLTQQRDVLDGLRARAGTLVAAASVATAFLSAQAIGGNASLNTLGWAAVVLFCAVIFLSLAILVPWGWTFTHHPHLLIGVHLESEDPPRDWKPSTLSEIYRNISYWNGVHYNENGLKLEVMFVLFAVACGALAVEIVLWLILLAR